MRSTVARCPNQFIIDQARGLEAIHVLAAASVMANRSRTWTADLGWISAALDLFDCGPQ